MSDDSHRKNIKASTSRNVIIAIWLAICAVLITATILYFCGFHGWTFLLLVGEPQRAVDKLEYAGSEYVLSCKETYEGMADITLKECPVDGRKVCKVVEQTSYFSSCDSMELQMQDGIIIVPGYFESILTYVP